MTFLDQQNMRQVGSPAPSPDRKWLLYTISVPDWKEARRQTDIYVVSMDQGVGSTRQLTYTKDKSEGAADAGRLTARSSCSHRTVTRRRIRLAAQRRRRKRPLAAVASAVAPEAPASSST